MKNAFFFDVVGDGISPKGEIEKIPPWVLATTNHHSKRVGPRTTKTLYGLSVVLLKFNLVALSSIYYFGLWIDTINQKWPLVRDLYDVQYHEKLLVIDWIVLDCRKEQALD